MKIILVTLLFAGLAVAAPERTIAECLEVCTLFLRRLKFNAEKHIVFRLFTRRNPITPQIITYNNTNSLNESEFNGNTSTRFIIHGWRNNDTSEVNTMLTYAYMDRHDYNIFIVDWGEGAKTCNYFEAQSRVKEVGRSVAKFIDWINETKDTSFTQISVVGHSLGAHIAGLTGKYVRRGRLNTVVALDPAKMSFSLDEPENRVSSTDADNVIVIHTSKLGFQEPLGTADFYPNWGYSQPGCELADNPCPSCSHSRAYEYFADAILNPKLFMATKCTDYEEIRKNYCKSTGKLRSMGDYPSQFSLTRGIFFVNSANDPFGCCYIYLTYAVVLVYFVNKNYMYY